jgi:hypothetical protein
MLRIVTAAVVAAGIWSGAATQASAYDYVIVGGPLKQVWLHTVSAFCHDRTWTGNWYTQGNPVRISTASICLVDRVELTLWNNQVVSWSGVGVPSQGFVLKYGLDGKPYIDPFERGWMR